MIKYPDKACLQSGKQIPSLFMKTYDLSTGSTETKYINAKTQNIFCCVNENLTIFFIHFDRGDKKTEEEKKVYTKVKYYF